MASINASTSGAGGVITTADNTGTLQLQSGGTTIATVSSTGLALNAGNITLPSGAAPAFSAYNNANQTLNNNTSYKVLFQVEEFDTNSNFASSRFTPTVAGYYQINAQVLIENNSNAGTLLCQILKNGADYKSTQSTIRSGSNTTALCCSVIYFNGSTDYIEIYALQASGATATLIANSFLSTWISGAFVRSA
jgi:hypothetical protein